MTNNQYAEMDLQVATAIMGWSIKKDRDGKVISFTTEANQLYYYSEDSNERDWKPSLSMACTFDVVEKLRQQGVFLDVHCNTEGYFISIYSDGHMHESMKGISIYELPFKICEFSIETLNGTI